MQFMFVNYSCDGPPLGSNNVMDMQRHTLALEYIDCMRHHFNTYTPIGLGTLILLLHAFVIDFDGSAQSMHIACPLISELN